MTELQSQLRQAFYPQWIYTGGYILIEVLSDGKVIVQGYREPDREEAEIIIHKVKTIASVNPYWQRVGSDEPPILLSLLNQLADDISEEVEEEVKQDINAFKNFIDNIKKSAKNQFDQNIKNLQIIFNLFVDTKNATEKNIQNLSISYLEANKKAFEWLTTITQEAGQQFVNSLKKRLDDYSKIWLERIIEIIDCIDYEKSKQVVDKLKNSYPQENSSQIANRLILEKALFSILISTGEIIPGASILVDWYGTNVLLVQMIYQIAVIYGYRNLAEVKGEILAIYLLGITGDTLKKLGLNFLKSHTPLSGLVISAGTNMVMFHLMGSAACEFYEAKSQGIDLSQIFLKLQDEMKVFLEKALQEQSTFDKLVVQAIPLEETLITN